MLPQLAWRTVQQVEPAHLAEFGVLSSLALAAGFFLLDRYTSSPSPLWLSFHSGSHLQTLSTVKGGNMYNVTISVAMTTKYIHT